jgi:hypothetical protein
MMTAPRTRVEAIGHRPHCPETRPQRLSTTAVATIRALRIAATTTRTAVTGAEAEAEEEIGGEVAQVSRPMTRVAQVETPAEAMAAMADFLG